MATLDDLAGKEIVVRRSSSYYESLVALNEKFRREGKPAVELTPADENLEDEDLIEMVNAGLYPLIVVDEHKARFWKQVFPDIVMHEDIAVRSGGEIAWAFRKDSPKLKAEINAFVKDHKIGTTFGNILMRRYFKDAKYVKKSMSVAELKKFRDTVAIFQRTRPVRIRLADDRGAGLPGIRRSTRARGRGAVGVMQVMPKTAAGMPN